MMNHSRNCLSLLLLWTLSFAGYCFATNNESQSNTKNASPNIVKFPRVNDAQMFQEQANYYYELLQLALDHADNHYEIEVVSVPIMPLSRSMINIRNGEYDVHWAQSSIEREALLEPVRFPILKGLVGLRIALINTDSKHSFADIMTVDELKKHTFGQGHDWIDTKILNAYGFSIVEPFNNTSLYELLKRQRIDMFPRSVMEAWFEQEHVSDPLIQVDEHIAIYYTLPTYFFVRKEDKELQQQLYLGLNRALANGSFDRLFERYFQRYIDQANLDKRQIFHLENPYLPASTPLQREELWFALPAHAKKTRLEASQ
ncbi:substrate-binding periplasmic protein [Ningiella sp. W23]|uniref:substrate-binding periplasmic protein n=1 Tax=Ningiella sp. W23 TaxID=3023715 RepID=UPI003756F585